MKDKYDGLKLSRIKSWKYEVLKLNLNKKSEMNLSSPLWIRKHEKRNNCVNNTALASLDRSSRPKVCYKKGA